MSHLRPAALACAVLALACAPATSAAKPPASTSSCPAKLSQAFLPYADPALYYLAPGGDFEKATWAGGARVRDTDPFKIGGATGSWALEVAGEVVSPPMCIGLGEPTMRFVARETVGSPTGALGIAMRYTAWDGSTQDAPLVPLMQPDGRWYVTPQVLLPWSVFPQVQATGTAPLDPSLATANVRLVFTPSAGSVWRIDDVHIDPYSRR